MNTESVGCLELPLHGVHVQMMLRSLVEDLCGDEAPIAQVLQP